MNDYGVPAREDSCHLPRRGSGAVATRHTRRKACGERGTPPPAALRRRRLRAQGRTSPAGLLRARSRRALRAGHRDADHAYATSRRAPPHDPHSQQRRVEAPLRRGRHLRLPDARRLRAARCTGGDGGLTARRHHARWRDPGDDRGWRDGPAGRAGRPRWSARRAGATVAIAGDARPDGASARAVAERVDDAGRNAARVLDVLRSVSSRKSATMQGIPS